MVSIRLVSSWRPLPGDEDPARVVDPDLLDRRVVEERLQRAEAGHPGDQLADHRVDVGNRRDRAGQAAVVVVADDALGDPAYEPGVALRVDALAADELAHVLVEDSTRSSSSSACPITMGTPVSVRGAHPR